VRSCLGSFLAIFAEGWNGCTISLVTGENLGFQVSTRVWIENHAIGVATPVR
jgi:hypothetical protein